MNHSIYGFLALKRPDRAQKGNTNYKGSLLSNSRCQNADKTPHTHFHSFKNHWQKNKRIKQYIRHTSLCSLKLGIYFPQSRTSSPLYGDVCRQAVIFKQCTSETSGSWFTVRELIGKHDKDRNEKVKKNRFLSRTKTLRLQYCDPLHHIALVGKFLWRALHSCNVKSFRLRVYSCPLRRFLNDENTQQIFLSFYELITALKISTPGNFVNIFANWWDAK